MSRPRDRGQGAGAAIEGFAACAWFSWGQPHPPAWLATGLKVGTVLGLVLTVAGIVVAVRSPKDSGALADPVAMRRYRQIVWLELGALAVLAALFAILGRPRWIAVVVCAGVGLHFLPLAPVVRQPILGPSGVVLVLVSVAALVAGLAHWTTPSTVTGAGAGVVLLGTGALTLLGVGVRPVFAQQPTT